MTIRKKMLLAFLAVGLLVVLAVSVIFIDYRKINSAVNIVKEGQDINKYILEIRKQEKNYLLWYDDIYLENISENTKELKGHIILRKEQTGDKELLYALDRVESFLAAYEDLFNRIVENHKLHKLTAEEIRYSGRILEEAASESAEADKITIWILQARREEKNYSLYRDIALIAGEKSCQDKFTDAIAGIKIASGIDPQIVELADQYNAAFLNLVDNYQKGDELIVQLREKAVITEEGIGEIVDKAWDAIEEAQRITILLTFLVLITTIIAVVFLSFFLSNKITRPINLLTSAAGKISKGNLSQRVEARSGDEIGILAKAFDKMRKDLIKADAVVKDELAEANTELSAANKELEAFSYSVSHDLRTPLRAIDGFSKMLTEDYAGSLDKQGKHYLQRVRAGAQNMGQLIDDLLDLSRVGRQPMNKKETNLRALAGETFKSLKDEYRGRKVNFTIRDCQSVFTDPNLIKIVFVNLFSNALKFTRDRSIAEIEVGCNMKDKQTVYYVRDNGIGFDMKYADRLFIPFQQLHSKGEYEGTGIGLATVKRIIDRHNGQIWVESKPDMGATFYFTLQGDK